MKKAILLTRAAKLFILLSVLLAIIPSFVLTETSSAQLEKLRQNLSQLELFYTDKHPDVIKLKRRIKVLEKEIAAQKLSQPDLTDPSNDSAQLEKLYQELLQLKLRYKDKHPDVIRLQNRIGALEKEIDAEKLPQPDLAEPLSEEKSVSQDDNNDSLLRSKANHKIPNKQLPEIKAEIENTDNDPSQPSHPAQSYQDFYLPEELPVPGLKSFKVSHPRLPAPSVKDIYRLQTENPKYISSLKNKIKRPNANLKFIILAAYLEPGSQDTEHLFQRLISLEFESRGHEQLEPLAHAYDWLYNQWSPKQKIQLQEKLLEGCNYIINFIRERRLSPYNVYFYNRPFPALVAGTIAVFKDHPGGDSVMVYTYDFWKNRVFPVWRQVMGENGGWHETGGYLAISLGQVIYQIPAMWRSATGEDLFRKEPWLQGFLDFLVYRERPDGTHFRWGDSAFFDRIIVDRVALALEYRHAAAYSLRRPWKQPQPTSWPWGPLTDDTLYNPRAKSKFPFAKYFDGIGMIIVNSNWSPDATYVTFKAGDNFWSHSHLDQGAFTIYKGGSLAIDSGIYPQYGSDHHMNYYYQAIAHNVITVTDPQDNLPKPGTDKRPPRQIANDGGQRRVGSGWGEPAPIDINEWKANYETYHTGSMKSVLIEDDIVAAIADVTPAYTNKRSGTGTFQDRTHRVENFMRFFGYDRVNDVIIIYDIVSATKDGFLKRWLLHTINKPLETEDGFRTIVPLDEDNEQPGGIMDAHVLLPREYKLQFVGGPGQEFFVDGRNYDIDGKVGEMVEARRNQPEPGAWRIEILPKVPSRKDAFLVVMVPRILNKQKNVQIKILQDGKNVGCEVIGPDRTTKWLLSPDLKNAVIEISEEKINLQHQLQVD